MVSLVRSCHAVPGTRSLITIGIPARFKLVVDPTGENDSNSVIRTTALERGVLALPGTVFYPNGRKSAYVRASFSQLEAKDVDEALRRLREAVLDSRA